MRQTIGGNMIVYLKRSITVQNESGQDLYIAKGTRLYFDSSLSIAFYNDTHFYLEPDEYTILN